MRYIFFIAAAAAMLLTSSCKNNGPDKIKAFLYILLENIFFQNQMVTRLQE